MGKLGTLDSVDFFLATSQNPCVEKHEFETRLFWMAPINKAKYNQKFTCKRTNFPKRTNTADFYILQYKELISFCKFSQL